MHEANSAAAQHHITTSWDKITNRFKESLGTRLAPDKKYTSSIHRNYAIYWYYMLCTGTIQRQYNHALYRD